MITNEVRWNHNVVDVMNSTCIQYEGSRLEYIQVQELENMHKTPYRTRINTNICIHLTPPSNSRWIKHTEFNVCSCSCVIDINTNMLSKLGIET